MPLLSKEHRQLATTAAARYCLSNGIQSYRREETRHQTCRMPPDRALRLWENC
jgi:hypothetical protein